MHKQVKPHEITISRDHDRRYLTLNVTNTGVDVTNHLSEGPRQYRSSRDDAGNLISFYLNRPSYTITRKDLDATNNS